MMPCGTPVQSQPTILRSAPCALARIAAPGLDSMLSTCPASNALCAMAPFLNATMSSFSPFFAAKPCRVTIQENPASPFGWITPWRQALSSAAPACPDRARTPVTATAQARPTSVFLIAHPSSSPTAAAAPRRFAFSGNRHAMKAQAGASREMRRGLSVEHGDAVDLDVDALAVRRAADAGARHLLALHELAERLV